jgi:5'-nucleotidase / UDP-sugar diphosphatase
MKHTLRNILLSFFFLSLSVATAQQTITILHLNDTHSNLSTGGPRDANLKGSLGGYARAVSAIGMEKQLDPTALLLHAGDSFSGDLAFNAFFGVAEIQMLNQLGFDAMTVGNHEFDLTSPYLLQVLATAQPAFPLLSANMVIKDTNLNALKMFISSHVIKKIGNLKVGIFGITTPATNMLSFPGPQVNFPTTSTELLTTIATEVQTLRKGDSCDVVIMLSHLGIILDRQVAAGIPGIDAVVGGHDHYLTKQSEVLVNTADGRKVPVVQADALYHDLGKLRLTVNNGVVSFLDWTAIPLDTNMPEYPPAAVAIDTLQARINALYGYPWMTQKIADIPATFAEAADSLGVVGNRDTPVGNLVADAYRAAFKTDIAITACGMTAQPLYKGPIVANDIMRMIGYGFNTRNGLGYRLMTFEISGAAVCAGLTFGLSEIGANDEFLLQVSGMKYGYQYRFQLADPTTSYGALDPASIEIGGKSLDLQKMYTVTANEFAFGFLQYILSQASLPQPTNVAMPDSSATEFLTVYGYLAAAPGLTPVVEGRVRCLSVLPTDHPADFPRTMDCGHYPNPVSSNVSIFFTVPADGITRLSVYDLTGREIATLLNDAVTRGTHVAQFNVSSLAPGLYTYRLQQNGSVLTRKMIVVK